MFNPIPKDAPEFFSDKAHYIDCKTTVSRSRMANNGHETRFYVFSIGRSIKNYHVKDKFIDNQALKILEKAQDKRLVIKGYTSPSLYGSSMFVVLTHIGIYHKLSRGGYRIYNPNTGELGYYSLATM